MRRSYVGKGGRIRWALLGAVVVPMAALLLVAGPFTSAASAETFPIIFPFEKRLPVTHQFMIPRTGHLHQGIDLIAPKMTKMLAVVPGTVTLQMRLWNGLPWYTLWLAGDDGRGYYYSHINNDTPGTDDGRGDLAYAFAPGLVTGSRVEQGQFIAYCGDSGNAEGSSPHLHFEIHETTEWGSPALDPYDSLFAAPLADGTPPPPWPALSLTRYEQTSSLITYTGVWNDVSAGVASGGTYRSADSRANAVIWFEGTSLTWIAATGPGQGQALVSLDGQAPVVVDLGSGGRSFDQAVWSTGTLPQGTHTVTITWDEASSSGGGMPVNIDAVEVMGTLIQAPQVAVSQQSSSLLSYAGTWTTLSAAEASGGSLAATDSPGSSVTLDFTGFYLCLVASRGPAYGQVAITVDGGDPEVVDLFNPSATWRQKVWNSGYLPYGRHVVNIEWTGLKNPASAGTGINVDALEIVGRLTQEVFPTPDTLYPRHEQTDPRISYDKPWETFATTSASAGSYGRSSTDGASATVSFKGTRLDWMAMKGLTTGKADVYLDGDYKTTIDLANPAGALYKVKVWSTGDLPDGLHTVRIVRSTDNLVGKYITIDAVEVAGTLLGPPPTLTGLSPASGPAAGGAQVVITGTGFLGLSGPAAVTFGGLDARSYTVDSPTRITAVAPPHEAGTVRVAVTTPAGTTPDSAADDFTYTTVEPPDPPSSLTRIEQTDSRLVYGGTWSTFTTSSAYGGSYGRSSTDGASATIPFKGTRLDWMAMKGLTTGKADVYLDGDYKTTVDLSNPAGALYKVKVWSTGDLPAGLHTVRIVRSSDNLTGKYITIDAVEVAGTLLGPTRIEQTDSRLVWAGTWTSVSSPSYSGGSFRYANKSGSTVTIKFTGARLTLIAKKAPNYGIARVSIDGGPPVSVDFYSSSTLYKQKVWSTPFLTPGDHTVTIAWTGTKRPAATATNINLDAVEVTGVLR